MLRAFFHKLLNYPVYIPLNRSAYTIIYFFPDFFISVTGESETLGLLSRRVQALSKITFGLRFPFAPAHTLVTCLLL